MIMNETYRYLHINNIIFECDLISPFYYNKISTYIEQPPVVVVNKIQNENENLPTYALTS